MVSNNKIRNIEIQGSNRERGFQHGKALKVWIIESLDLTKYFLAKKTKQDSRNLFATFAKENELIHAVKKWTPDLLEEVEGIADGADLDFDDLFAYQCAEEILMVLPYEKRDKSSPMPHHCSSLGCYPTSELPAFIGQNMDWMSMYEKLTTLLHIQDEKNNLESYINTIPGLIALNGMNNSPLAVCVNSLEDDLNCSGKGLPVAFIVRALLEKSTVDEALDFLTSINHASGQNYMIGDKNKVVDYECSANKKVQFIPQGNPKRVYHTNHPIINTDLRVPPLKLLGNRSTFARFEYLQYRMQVEKPFNIECAKLALSSFFGPICVINKGENFGWMTIYSSLFQ
ncbi:MAG: C45 family autoproteolytic acyltransferase/hydrolase, partial [Candidatus Kariarchaeaceae archaeon]